MPINKQFLKSRPEVKVTFAVEKEAAGDAEQVLLLGEFSQWQPIELKRMKNGEFKALYVHNICDHEACFAEVGSQAISYTTGVPAMIGAKQMLTGSWKKPGVWNIEQHDPDAFMADLNVHGLPWSVIELSRQQAEALQVV